MLLLYASYGALPIMLLHIYHTPADSVSVPPVGLLLGVGFVEPWRAPFLLLCFFNTFLPPAYALCQPQIADLAFFFSQTYSTCEIGCLLESVLAFSLPIGSSQVELIPKNCK